MPAQPQHNQVPYPAQQAVSPQQNMGNLQMMYDANGNPVYVQLMYDRTGKAIYVQMQPKIVGRDAAGNPVYSMVPVGQVRPSQQQMQSQQMQSQQMQSQQMQSQQMQSQQMPQQKSPSFLNNVSQTTSQANAQFIPRNNMQPPPVPVMPRPGEQPEQPAVSIPDRPAVKASSLASAMYTASQPQNFQGTGSFFARMQQQKQMQSGYTQPMNAQELLREEAQTAFVQQPASAPPDENAVLRRIFETKQQEYQMNTGNGNSTFAVDVPADEVKSVSEKNLYQPPEKTAPRPAPVQPVRKPEPEPRPVPEPAPEPKEKEKETKSEGLRFFRSRKNKEKPKHKTIIVDPDEIFGDSKKHKVEMLGVSIDGDENAVDDKIREMKQGGKKSKRSMIAADVSLESMVDDPLSGDAARKALTDEVVQQAYDSIESAEIAKALEQLNQGIFPKSTKD